MKPLAEMTDQELIDHIEALHQASLKLMRQKMEIYREEARRKPVLRRYDPDQLDHDEYIEEMSLGGSRYRP